MNDSPLPPVSVVIPCRNRANTVGAAVRSVLDQDYPNLEIIAVDDGSTDDTLGVLHSINDTRLHVLSSPGPRGPSAARNFGVQHATRPWVAFQDSDDLWRAGRLSRQMPRLAVGNWVAGFCAMEVRLGTQLDDPIVDRYPRPTDMSPSNDVLFDLLRGSFVSTQMLILRRDVFARVGGFDISLPALVDWDLMLRVVQEGPVDFLEEVLVVQRLTHNSITWLSERRIRAQQQILEKHRDLFARSPEALARHHHRISGGLRATGDWHAAYPHALAAARIHPTRPRYLAALSWSWLLSMVR